MTVTKVVDVEVDIDMPDILEYIHDNPDMLDEDDIEGLEDMIKEWKKGGNNEVVFYYKTLDEQMKLEHFMSVWGKHTLVDIQNKLP